MAKKIFEHLFVFSLFGVLLLGLSQQALAQPTDNCCDWIVFDRSHYYKVEQEVVSRKEPLYTIGLQFNLMIPPEICSHSRSYLIDGGPVDGGSHSTPLVKIFIHRTPQNSNSYFVGIQWQIERIPEQNIDKFLEVQLPLTPNPLQSIHHVVVTNPASCVQASGGRPNIVIHVDKNIYGLTVTSNPVNFHLQKRSGNNWSPPSPQHATGTSVSSSSGVNELKSTDIDKLLSGVFFTNTMTIGNQIVRPDQHQYDFTGAIPKVALWKTELCLDDVRAFMSGTDPTTISSASGLHYWRFCCTGAASSEVRDSKGSRNALPLLGATCRELPCINLCK